MLEISGIGGARVEETCRLRSLGHEEQLDRVRPAEADAVAVLKGSLGDLLAVDERSVAGGAVAQEIASILQHNLGVFARHVGADNLQIGRRPAADHEQRSIEDDDSSSL